MSWFNSLRTRLVDPLSPAALDSETLDAALEQLRGVSKTLTRAELRTAERVSQALETHVGVDVSPKVLLTTGRVVLGTVIAAGVGECLAGVGEGFEGGAEIVEADAGAAEAATASAECPAILYDGMGNMDGTVTNTDGGMAYDSV